MLLQSRREIRGGGVVIKMRAAGWFRDDFIDDAELDHVFSRDAQSLCREIALAGVPPHDRSTALRREHRVDAVLEHEDTVSNRNGECSAGATFTSDGGDDRNFQSGHLAKIPRNRFGLSALFGTESRIRARRIHKCEQRPLELLRHLHKAQRLAIAFWIRLAEVAIDARFDVASFLMADDHNLFAGQSRYSADKGWVVAKVAVAVQLDPIGENTLHVIESVRAVRVASQLGAGPRARLLMRADLLAKVVYLLLQLVKLIASVLIVAGFYFQRGDLVDDGFELALGLGFDHLIDDPDRSLPEKLFDLSDEAAVGKDIIAVRLHDDHEVAVTLHVEHNLGVAFALAANAVQRVHLQLARLRGGNADANRARKLHGRGFEWSNFADGKLGIRTFFN